MRLGLLFGMAKLRRKKVPNLFLGICIAITTALLVNVLVLLRDLNGIFEQAYEGMEGAQLCCLWSNEMFSADFVRKYLDDSQEDFQYQITEHTKTINYIEKDGIKLSNGILLELPEMIGNDMLSPKMPDDLDPVMPQKGEIWITTKLANILHLKEGDEVSLQFADRDLKVWVAKIVIDPVFGSSSTNVYRMWCGYGQLSDFPAAENHAVSYLEVRFDAYSRLTEQHFISDAEEYFEMPLGNALYTYDKIKGGYIMIYQMAGAVLCFVSVVLVLTVVILTIFLIKSDMEEDIRNIGLCKSLGMTGGQIVRGYLISYGSIAFIGATAGSAAGGVFSRKIIAVIFGNIGIYGVSFAGKGKYQPVVWLAVVFAVLLICFCEIFKIYRFNASDSIRKGTWQHREKEMKAGKNFQYNGRMSFELYYAVRGMRNKKIRYGFIAGVSIVLSSLTIVCTGCLNAIKNIDENPETWGFIKTDIYVTSAQDLPVSSIIDELEEDERIDYTYGVNKVYVMYKPYNAAAYQSIMTELYELPWNEKIHDRALYGRRPVKEDEIGVGLGLAQQYGLRTGETIELFVNGQKKQYEITEIFQTLSNSGNIFRMVTDNLDGYVETDGKYGDYMIVLRNSSEKWEFAQELADKYDGKFAFIASKSNGENFTGVLAPVILIVMTVFMAVIIMVTVNLTILLVRWEQGLIGLLKAVGMTSRQVLKIYVFRNCLSAAAGSCLGIAAGIFVLPHVLTPYAKGLGLTEFPFAVSMSGTLAGMILPPACLFVGTVVITKTIHSVTVKQLLNE